ncbi:hypothetical protein THAOC_19628, partial [Thalassiosira oceanica]
QPANDCSPKENPYFNQNKQERVKGVKVTTAAQDLLRQLHSSKLRPSRGISRTNYGVDAENQATDAGTGVRQVAIQVTPDAPGFGQQGFLGPFSQAQNGFWRGGGYPPGGVGAIIKHRSAESPQNVGSPCGLGRLRSGQPSPPLANTDRKGGAFLIMHQQFLRAVGVTAAAAGNAALKLSRIHYLRSTKREAAHAANTNHSKYRS